MNTLSLVIPTFNEAGNIGNLFKPLLSVLEAMQIEFEVIVVDDNSMDGTAEIVEKLSLLHNRIRLIRRKERGLAKAVVIGWSNAKGNILGVMDADMQHPVELLKTMLNNIANISEADIVVASRYIKPGYLPRCGLWHRGISRSAILLCSLLFPGLSSIIKDPTSGYFLIRREVISGIELNPIGYKILLEVVLKGRYRKVLEVPYNIKKRNSGLSKAGLKQYLFFILHIVKLRIQYKRGVNKEARLFSAES